MNKRRYNLIFLVQCFWIDGSQLILKKLYYRALVRTIKEVLKKYKFYRETIDDVDTRSNLVEEILRICDQLEIEPQQTAHIKRKLSSLYLEYQRICKSRYKPNYMEIPSVFIRKSARQRVRCEVQSWPEKLKKSSTNLKTEVQNCQLWWKDECQAKVKDRDQVIKMKPSELGRAKSGGLEKGCREISQSHW